MKTKHKLLAAAAAAMGVVVVVAGGNWHFVYGGDAPARWVRKLSWSLSETVVNLDEVLNLPSIVARSRYPMFLAAVERDARPAREAREAAERQRREAEVSLQAQNGIVSVRPGYSRATVVELMGEPDSTSWGTDKDGKPKELLWWRNVGTVALKYSVVLSVEPVKGP